MLTPQENERLTRVGPGTPMGEVHRRYWQPALLSSELSAPDCPPLRVRLLSEDLVAFRDSSGNVGLVDAYCPHRRAPLFFGRNEECGIRCVYHGWKFDRNGTCVDMPSEPPDSLLKSKVTATAYPTWEGGGMVWTYMGPPETLTAHPDYEVVRAPETHFFVSKTFEECNWLQAFEGGIDTSHSSFAHNMDISKKSYLRSLDTAPRLEVDKTDYGYRYAGIRQTPEAQYVRVYHYIMPAQQCRGRVTHDEGKGLREVPIIQGHIWVPIDDTHTWSYNWAYSYTPDIPLSLEYALEKIERWDGRHPDELLSEFRPKRNLRNDYMIDREVQRTKTFTGIQGVNTQDMAIQEGMGPICDRSKEHLGTSDRAIIAARQLLFEAADVVEEGGMPRGSDTATYRSVRATDRLIPKDSDWREALQSEILARF